MLDEENSAHQFSLHDRSMQADSEERHEVEMQTSALEYKSHIDQTSMQNAKSAVIQTSEIDMLSAKCQVVQGTEVQCQTDPSMLERKKTPPRKAIRLQTQRYKDVIKNDWSESILFRTAQKSEALKRGFEEYADISSDDDDTSNDSYKSPSKAEGGASPMTPKSPGKTKDQGVGGAPPQEMNAQDPDTDMPVSDNEQANIYIDTALGLFKSI